MTKEEYNKAVDDLGMWRMQLMGLIQYPFNDVHIGTNMVMPKAVYINMINSKIYELTSAIAEYERDNNND